MKSSKGLHLKSYFASSVGEALEIGQRELGEEALLVDTRLAPPAAMHLGRYEVVLAVAPDEEYAIDNNLTAAAIDDKVSRPSVQEMPARMEAVTAPVVPAVEQIPTASAHTEAPPAEPRKRRRTLTRVIRMLSVSNIAGALLSVPREMMRIAADLTSNAWAGGSDLVESALRRLRPRRMQASGNQEAVACEPAGDVAAEEQSDGVLFGLPVAQDTTAIVDIAAHNSLQAEGTVEISSVDMGEARPIEELRGRPRNRYLPSLGNPTSIRTSCARRIKQTNESLYPYRSGRFSRARKKQRHD